MVTLPMLTTEDYTHFPAIQADQRLFYGPGRDQFGDLYLPRQVDLHPQSDQHPVLIVLHGGCWSARYGLEPLGRLCAAFAAEGLAVWNVEYRRLGDGGGWPMTFADVAASADFLRSIAQTYSLDLSRVVALGHSAGGHLALWLAARHRLPVGSPLYTATPLPIHGVLSIAGVPDLAEALKQGLCGDAVAQLIGGSPARYQQTSPVALLPLGVRQWHIIGRDDDTVHVDYLQRYTTIAALHDEVYLDILPDAGHFEPVDPTTAAWPVIRDAVLSLIYQRFSHGSSRS
jgi:acetyl esterase/lipase